MKELTIAATPENIEAVTDFVQQQLEAIDCPPKPAMQIAIAIDELFGNIARYAYAPDIGDVNITVDVTPDPTVTITFADRGVPYDPLTAEEPDTSLNAEDRDFGGLGIFISKSIMDDISYQFKDGQNILTVTKQLK